MSWVDCDGNGGGVWTCLTVAGGMLKLKMLFDFGSGDFGDLGGCGGLPWIEVDMDEDDVDEMNDLPEDIDVEMNGRSFLWILFTLKLNHLIRSHLKFFLIFKI